MRLNFIFLFMANFFFFLTGGIFHLFPLHLGSLGATKTYIGIAMGSANVIQILIMFALRNKADTINKKKLLIFAACGGILVFPLFYFTNHLGLILGLRVLHGVIIGIGFPIASALAIDIIPKEKRVSLIGIFGTSGALSNLFGPALAEFISGKFHFKYVFFAAGMVAFVWLCFLLLIKNVAPKTVHKEKPANIRDYKNGVILAIIFGTMFSTFFAFISDYARTIRLQPVSVFFVSYTLFLILLRFIMSRQIDAWNYSRLIRLGFMLAFFSLIFGGLLFRFSLLSVLAAAGVFYGAAHGFLYPTLNSYFIALTPHRSSKATLMFILFFNTGISTASIGYGFIADLTGYPVMYFFSAAVVIVAFMLLRGKIKAADHAAASLS